MNFKSILVTSIITLSSIITQAEVVQNVVINGLKDIPEPMVEKVLTIKVGQDISSKEINQQITDLYETNFFKQVSVSLEDGVLFVSLEEQPEAHNTPSFFWKIVAFLEARLT